MRRLRGGRRRTVNNPSWGRSLPAAYASHVRPRFNVGARTATSCRVTGCDLVYPIPASVTAGDDSIFCIIPANPAYWTGTRIAQFAPAYMNYRPISMTFSYIPQVAVTQPGTVFMGTFWNGAAPQGDLQQSLFTSNGGCLTQCYIPCDTRIKLGTNLQYNLYQLNREISPASNPFIFLAGIRGGNVVPGYFYVTYTYEFKNPIGQSWTYERQENVVASDVVVAPNQNVAVVLQDQMGDLGPGTVLDVESAENEQTNDSQSGVGKKLQSIFKYAGSVVKMISDAIVTVYTSYQTIKGGNLPALTTPDNPDAPTQVTSITLVNDANKQPVSLTTYTSSDLVVPADTTVIAFYRQGNALYGFFYYSPESFNLQAGDPYIYGSTRGQWNQVKISFTHGESTVISTYQVKEGSNSVLNITDDLASVYLGSAKQIGVKPIGIDAQHFVITSFYATASGGDEALPSQFTLLTENTTVTAESMNVVRLTPGDTRWTIKFYRAFQSQEFSAGDYYYIFKVNGNTVSIYGPNGLIMNLLANSNGNTPGQISLPSFYFRNF